MKQKKILVFGASGQIGRHLIRKLTSNNYTVTAITRNLHKSGYILKTQGNAGYIDIVETNIFDLKKIRNLISQTDICINLIGILYETDKINSFRNIHTIFPSEISKICKEFNIQQLVHLSALGIEQANDSQYAKSKLNAEINIKKNFPSATILKPSIVYSINDNFTTSFMKLLNILPFFPIYHKGKTKFMPIHCSDLVEIIYQVVSKKIISTTIECIGPELISFEEILKRLTKLIEKKRLIIPIPYFFGKLSAKFFEIFPKPLITIDQINLLKYDNISSGKYKTNYDIGVPSKRMFDVEVEKYAFMWKAGGQYSTKKYKID